MAATVAGLLTSLATSAARRLIGYCVGGRYYPGVINLRALARVGEDALATNTVKQYEFAATRLKEILRNYAPAQVTQRTAAEIKRGLIKTPTMANRIQTFGRLA